LKFEFLTHQLLNFLDFVCNFRGEGNEGFRKKEGVSRRVYMNYLNIIYADIIFLKLKIY